MNLIALEKALKYLISAGITCFGLWIVAAPKTGSDAFALWMIVGTFAIAVGFASLLGAIRNDRAT
jgi:uncharacterized membrane protein HdeD (DUF308 family)